MARHTEIKALHTGPLGVNTYIVSLSGNRVLVVDPSDCDFSGDGGTTSAFLKEQNLSPVCIVLTHGHFDHLAALPNLRKNFPSLPILIHANDKDYLGEKSEFQHSRVLCAMGFAEFIPSVAALPCATAFLEDGKLLSHYADFFAPDLDDGTKDALSKWLIIHTPGHTPGSVCLFNAEEKILLSGDTLFHGSYGRTDLYGGSEHQMQESLTLLASLCKGGTRLYPGHD